MDETLPFKTVETYSLDKPWMTAEIKRAILKRQKAQVSSTLFNERLLEGVDLANHITLFRRLQTGGSYVNNLLLLKTYEINSEFV